MLISRTSRYQRNITAVVDDRNGAPQRYIVHRQPVAMTLQVNDYLWRQGDRVDSLAASFYGSESSWWMIAEANPSVLDWVSVPAGTRIRVPRVA
jgi:phage tail protein X